MSTDEHQTDTAVDPFHVTAQGHACQRHMRGIMASPEISTILFTPGVVAKVLVTRHAETRATCDNHRCDRKAVMTIKAELQGDVFAQQFYDQYTD